MPSNKEVKTCSSCKIEKSVDCFYKKSRKTKHGISYGLCSICSVCSIKRTTLYRKMKPEKSRAYNKSKIRHKQRNKEYNKKYQIKNGFKNRLKNKFNITESRYNEILLLQYNSCAICKTHKSKFTRRLAVDHCHQSNEIRGLLCNKCNTAIGLFADNPALLISAAKYILKYKIGNYEKD